LPICIAFKLRESCSDPYTKEFWGAAGAWLSTLRTESTAMHWIALSWENF